VTASDAVRRRTGTRFSGLAWRRARWGYLFIAPWLIGFVLFTAFPMVATFVFTLTNINLAQETPLRFVGLENYQDMLNDKQAWAALGVTAKYALLALPVAVILPLLVALMLHSRHLRGAGAFRVLFFLPYVVPFIAGVLIWGSMLSSSRRYVELDPWPAIFPGLAIMVLVLGFNLFGDGLRDVLDPRLRIQS